MVQLSAHEGHFQTRPQSLLNIRAGARPEVGAWRLTGRAKEENLATGRLL